MTDTPTPPDGWYPDPAGGGGLRRWDGASWTDELRSVDGTPLSEGEKTPDAAADGAASTPEAASDGDSKGESAAEEAGAFTTSTDGVADAPAVAPAGHGEPEQSAAPEQHAAEAAPEQHAAEAAPEGSSAYAVSEQLAAPPAPVAPPATVGGGAAAAAASTPPVPPPVAPAPPAAAPAYSSAPAYPSAPAPSSGAAPGGAPAYPGSTSTGYEPAPRRDINTNTVWVWLLVFLPLVGVLPLFLFDWSTFISESFYAGAYGVGSGPAETIVSAVASIAGLVYSAVTVLFAYLDWRQLRARGVERPFHWAWSFFVLAISSGLVYVIGRSVIARKRTGRGLAPLWAAIAVNVVALVAGIGWAIYLLWQLIPLIEELQYYGY